MAKRQKNMAVEISHYMTDRELFNYASRYWDGKINPISCSRALRIAMNDPECPRSIDPFESLIDHEPSLYAKPDECGQVWDEARKIYIDKV